MDPLTNALDTAITKTEFLPSILNPIGKEIGTALSNLLHVAFFPFNWAGERVRYYEQKQIISFVDEINDAAESIPEDKLILPRTSIVGSAMENSKYCLDEPELRKMFANLIASSINLDKQPYIRQSFAETIKQLEPIDAENLKYFAKFCDDTDPNNMIKPPIIVPCVNYIMTTKTARLNIYPNLFLTTEMNENYKMQSSSISNLVRLGLVSCDYSLIHSDDSEYDIYRNNPDYLKLAAEYAEDKETVLSIQKGILNITPLGWDFIKTCVL